MRLSTDNQHYVKKGFIDFVESLHQEDMSEMQATRVIPSFLGAMHRHNIISFDQNALYYWIIEMFLQTMKPATVQRYLGTLHTIYSEWNDIAHYDFQPQFNLSGFDNHTLPDVEKIKQTNTQIRLASNIQRINRKPHTADYTYQNALLYLLINPTVSLSDVIDFKFSDTQPDSFHINDIKTSMRNAPQAKYVFPLQQGKRRKPAILRDLLSGIHKEATAAGLDFGDTFSRESLTSMWIAAAIKENITIEEIRSIVNVMPAQYNFLSIVKPIPLTDVRKIEIINRVADVFCNKSTGWYVMRLRNGVTPEDIKKQLQDLRHLKLHRIQFYYPMRKVKKASGKNFRFKDVPILPGILFFRTQYNLISKLMGIVGANAWCYRTSNNPSSPYSSIPQREMKTFQRCVGTLTSDIKMEIVSSLPSLNIGDEVVIENGTPLDGQHAVIRKIRSIDGSLTYALRLSDSEFIRWQEVNLHPSDISKK